MKAVWRKFRDLPAPLRAVAALAVVAGYTVLAITVFGGDDESPGPRGPEPVARDELERRIAGLVENGADKRAQATDVTDFRKPRIRRVRCDGTRVCEIFYAVGVPGGGRIFEQQGPIVREVLVASGVTELRITVVRGGPRETGVPSKAEEETTADTPLLRTDCDRRSVTDEELRKLSLQLVLLRLCKVQGGPGAGTTKNPGKGAEGSGILETGKP